MTDRGGKSRQTLAAERFSAVCSAVVRRLPWGLSRLVAPSFLGFAVINGFTFGVDLLLLTAFHGGLGLPVGVSFTLGYVGALSLSFVLNRTLNFDSHAPAGRQAVLFAVVIAINYFAILLGVGSGLAAAGVQYHVSRMIAGLCEAVFVYCAMRWVVFAVEPTRIRSAEADVRSEDRV